jgi:hypothetical protein
MTDMISDVHSPPHHIESQKKRRIEKKQEDDIEFHAQQSMINALSLRYIVNLSLIFS